jgi:hypothetical protein
MSSTWPATSSTDADAPSNSTPAATEPQGPAVHREAELHTGAALLTDKQKDRPTALFAVEEQVVVHATWGSTSGMIARTATPARRRGGT